MNKDIDERLLPNGEYRDAINVQVRTTSSTDDGIGAAGTVQNIKGTILRANAGDTLTYNFRDYVKNPVDGYSVDSIWAYASSGDSYSQDSPENRIAIGLNDVVPLYPGQVWPAAWPYEPNSITQYLNVDRSKDFTRVVASVADEKNNKAYFFIASPKPPSDSDLQYYGALAPTVAYKDVLYTHNSTDGYIKHPTVEFIDSIVEVDVDASGVGPNPRQVVVDRYCVIETLTDRLGTTGNNPNYGKKLFHHPGTSNSVGLDQFIQQGEGGQNVAPSQIGINEYGGYFAETNTPGLSDWDGTSFQAWKVPTELAKKLRPGMTMTGYKTHLSAQNTLDPNTYYYYNAQPIENYQTVTGRIKQIVSGVLYFYDPIFDSLEDVDTLVFKDEGVLKFAKSEYSSVTNPNITGVNIIDDFLFWTDNYSEPKKINIKRSKHGTVIPKGDHYIISEGSDLSYNDPNYQYQTEDYFAECSLSTFLKLKDQVSGEYIYPHDIEYSSIESEGLNLFFSGYSTGVNFLKEEHITVIRKAPTTAPTIHMESRDPISVLITDYSFDLNSDETSVGTEKWITNQNTLSTTNFRSGDVIKFTNIQDAELIITAKFISYLDDSSSDFEYSSVTSTSIAIEILGSEGDSSTLDTTNANAKMFTVELIAKTDPIFELEMCRFGYRYQYEDGEYSSFSPFSEIAFKPGEFDYESKKGFNLGMVNTITNLVIKDFIPPSPERPRDVAAVDILYKKVNEPNVFVVKTITRGLDPEWQLFTQSPSMSDVNSTGELSITSEMIHRALPADQILRSWDNVPKFAKAQEISGNRLIYGNYTQGYDIKYPVRLSQRISSEKNFSTIGRKSIKSIRNYKFGIVFGDKYGRETPVISYGFLTGDETGYENLTSEVVVEKSSAPLLSSFIVSQHWDNPESSNGVPEDWMHYVKYYVKETSSEYYNLVMDRWYHADDDDDDAADRCIWLSFPSSDRNKVDIETYLILKNNHGGNTPVLEKARYKIIAIENEAPDFIKIQNRFMGQIQISGQDSDDSSNGIFLPSQTPDTNAVAPLALMDATKVYIGAENFNNFLNNYEKQGTLKLRFIGKTINADGDTLVQHETKFVPVTNFSIDDEGNAEIFFDKKFSQDVNFFQIFTDDENATLDASTSNLTYFVEFKEEVVVNLPEFDGKFFVKIEKDEPIKKYIIGDSPENVTHVPIVNYEVAYIDTQKNNPSDNGYVWGSNSSGDFDANVFPGLVAKYDSPSADPVASDGGVNFFALGCNGPNVLTPSSYPLLSQAGDIACDVDTNNKITANYQLETRIYWDRFYSNTTASNKVYIDSARASKYPADNPFGAFDEDGLKMNYKPTGLDQGGATSGTLGRMFLSRTQKGNGTNDAQFPGAWGEEGSDAQEMLTNLSTPGNRFQFGGYTTDSEGKEVVFEIISRQFSDEANRNFGNSSAFLIDGDTYRHAPAVRSAAFGGSGILTNILPDQTETGIGTPPTGISLGTYMANNEFDFAFIGGAGDNSIFEMDDDECGAVQCAKCVYENDYCLRYGFRFEFRRVDPDNPDELLEDGIDIEQHDPRAIRHDGTETLNIKMVKKVTVPGSIEVATEMGACWETEPKENVDLDLYYEASNALPMRLTEDNTLGYIPLNSSVVIKRQTTNGLEQLIDDTSEPQTATSSEIGFTNITNINHHIADVQHVNSGNTPVINIKSTTVSGDDTETLVDQTSHISIGDYIYFKHNDGVETASKITDYYKKSHTGTTVFTTTYPFGDNTLGVSSETGVSSDIIPILLEGFDTDTEITIDSVFRPVDRISFKIKLLLQTEGELDGTVTIEEVTSAANTDLINNMLIVGAVSDVDNVPTGIFIKNDSNNSSNELTLNNVSWMTAGTTYSVEGLSATGYYSIDPETWKYPVKLGWFNCYSFGNGVESDRIRDDFNATQMDNGVIVSTRLADYKEENRKNGMIYSGLYNSTSGVNKLNEFNMSNKITKDINPTYGSIQRLKTRDTDIVVLAEDKILKVLSNKDALFNADGNPQLVSTDRVLGQVIPFVGDYGISQNPESLAADQYRMYFTDKQRGAVLRLSMDGLTPISDAGMKGWFRENLVQCGNLLGTFDKTSGDYNLTLNYNLQDLDFSFPFHKIPYEWSWVDYTNNEFVQPSNAIVDGYLQNTLNYSTGSFSYTGQGVYNYASSNEDLTAQTIISDYKPRDITVSFNESSRGWVSFKTFVPQAGVSVANKYLTAEEYRIWEHNVDIVGSAGEIINRNILYSYFHPSSIDVVFNDFPDAIKSFKTLSYQGSIAENPLYDQIVNPKLGGWYTDSFVTDLQQGTSNSFLNKEGKWFSNVKGNMTDVGNLDTKEFSVQGIGFTKGVSIAEPPPTYISLLASPSYVQEGSAVTITLITENVPDGTYFTFDQDTASASDLTYTKGYTNPSDSSSFAINNYNWSVVNQDYDVILNDNNDSWDDSNGLYSVGAANGTQASLSVNFIANQGHGVFQNAKGRIFNNTWSRTFVFKTDCVDGIFHDTNTAGQPEPSLTNEDGSVFVPFGGNGVYNQTTGGYEINYNELRIVLDSTDQSGNSTLDANGNSLSLTIRVYKPEAVPTPIQSTLTVQDIGDNAPID